MTESQAAAGSRSTFGRYSPLKIAGALYVVAVFQFFVFELIAETLYPGYSVARNYISDLGATCVNPPSTLHCVVHQPSATIFDVSVFLFGLMLLAGTSLVYLGTRKKLYCVSAAVADIAILLAGVFPENTGWPHAVDSVVLFNFLGLSLILAWTIVNRPILRYLPVTFGALTLIFNLFNLPAEVVGVGGQERLLVLSALLGLFSIGVYLTGEDSAQQTATSGRDPIASGARRLRPAAVKAWTVAAIVATTSTMGLFVIIIAVVPAMAQADGKKLGLFITLLPDLLPLLLVASIILWIVTAARWLAQR
jgi:hypothetical membrane protein